MSAPPGFVRQLGLLWGLRLAIAVNSGKGGRRAWAAVAFLASSAPSVGLAVFFFRLLTHPTVAASQVWSDFLLNLLCFVTTSVWVAWPVLSAGVDDHSEQSRYAAFPISSFRLMFASTLAGLFEPRSLVFYGPVVGALWGYLQIRPPSSWLMAGLLLVSFVLFNAALSRVGLHLVLNVLRQHRSAQLLGGFFALVLLACSFIPPIDTSWLSGLGQQTLTLPDTVLEDAALALSRVPSGFLGAGVRALSVGRWLPALERWLWLVELTLVAFTVAYGLLLGFHRQSGRAGPGQGPGEHPNPFVRTPDSFRTLVVREALDLWHNPRARLLAFVPFILAILLKLLSGRDLFTHLLGQTADAWVMGSLCLYSAMVVGSTFAQNTFAYDGHGLAMLLAAPVKLSEVLQAKNLVHGGAALLHTLLVALFYRAYFGHGSLLDALCVVAGVAGLLPVLLCAGNFLSLYFPVKFHAHLKRRDKVPFLASMLGVVAASLGSAPFAWALRQRGTQGVDLGSLGYLLGWAVVSWLVYLASLPTVIRLLESRRELVLRAVTRD